MARVLGMKNTTLNFVLLASRLLLAWIFIHEGASLATNFDAASAGMAKMGVPAAALLPTIALQLIAGSAIALGWHARLGAAALGLFCVATAILLHNNFANRNELLHFEKDLAIAGGMFVLMLRGAGSLSVDACVRQNANAWLKAPAGLQMAKLPLNGRPRKISSRTRPDREIVLNDRI
jgi:putative oxidoreductase